MQSTSQMFDSVGDDGYGGMDPVLYDCIIHYKKTGQYPSFIDAHQKTNRNAQFHWRNRCMRYVVADNDMLVYVVQNTGRTRVVVRRGEVKTAIKFIHDRHGHAGQKVTQAAVARRLYWTGIHRDVAKYILECQYCRTRREMRKPPMFGGEIVEQNTANSPFSIDESLVVDRLMLNLPESNALFLFFHVPTQMFEYVDEDLEPYEEVVLEDMDDNLLFDQADDHFSSDKIGADNYLIFLYSSHILAENVEVGAEELIDGNDIVDVKPLSDEHPSVEESSATCSITQKSTRFSKRRPQIEETCIILSKLCKILIFNVFLRIYF
uniref:Integrase_H2C2 domain-containing protein n=1 Tax=Heterorhabditis bacteriophora TaxID=37862 RepID=A0A1I7X684_HETBA